VLIAVAQIHSFQWFYPAILLYTLLFSPTFSLSSALCFHNLKNAQKDFPKIRVWGTIGWIFIGLLIGYLQIEPTAKPMQIAAGSSFFMGIFCFTLPKTPPLSRASTFKLVDLLGAETLILLKNRSFVVLMISLSLITLPSSFYYSFVNPFMNELGISNAAGKMSIGQVSEIFFIMVLPFCFRKFSLKQIILLGMLAWSVRYFLFAFGNADNRVGLIYLALLLHGISYTFTFLAGQIYVDEQVPASIRNAAQGFVTFITMGLGPFIGALIAGAVVHFFEFPDGLHNWKGIWVFPAFFGMASAIFFLLFFRTENAGANRA
jgi:nucleoside transporter